MRSLAASTINVGHVTSPGANGVEKKSTSTSESDSKLALVTLPSSNIARRCAAMNAAAAGSFAEACAAHFATARRLAPIKSDDGNHESTRRYFLNFFA